MDIAAAASELAPEQLYLPVNSTVIAEIVISPHLIKYLITRENDPFIFHEV